MWSGCSRLRFRACTDSMRTWAQERVRERLAQSEQASLLRALVLLVKSMVSWRSKSTGVWGVRNGIGRKLNPVASSQPQNFLTSMSTSDLRSSTGAGSGQVKGIAPTATHALRSPRASLQCFLACT